MKHYTVKYAIDKKGYWRRRYSQCTISAENFSEAAKKAYEDLKIWNGTHELIAVCEESEIKDLVMREG
jgi:hypothetical protein